MELKLNYEYIIRERKYSLNPLVIKIKVLELTQTSILYKLIDNGHRVRMYKDDFLSEYKIIEELPKIIPSVPRIIPHISTVDHQQLLDTYGELDHPKTSAEEDLYKIIDSLFPKPKTPSRDKQDTELAAQLQAGEKPDETFINVFSEQESKELQEVVDKVGLNKSQRKQVELLADAYLEVSQDKKVKVVEQKEIKSADFSHIHQQVQELIKKFEKDVKTVVETNQTIETLIDINIKVVNDINIKKI